MLHTWVSREWTFNSYHKIIDFFPQGSLLLELVSPSAMSSDVVVHSMIAGLVLRRSRTPTKATATIIESNKMRSMEVAFMPGSTHLTILGCPASDPQCSVINDIHRSLAKIVRTI